MSEIKKLEDEISKKEEILVSLQEDLCKEEIYSNPAEKLTDSERKANGFGSSGTK